MKKAVQKIGEGLAVKRPVFDVVPLKPIIASRFSVPDTQIEWYVIGLERLNRQFVGILVTQDFVCRLRFTRQDMVRA